MGSRKYPPLTPKQIEDILISRGFIHKKNKVDHRYYVCCLDGKKRMVQIDWGVSEVSDHWLKLTIDQSGMTRKQFYSTTKEAAIKINAREEKKENLAIWLGRVSFE